MEGAWDVLPDEMQERVIRQMSVDEFLALLKTDRRQASRAHDERLWRHFFQRDFYRETPEKPFFVKTWRSYYMTCRRLLRSLGYDNYTSAVTSGINGAILCMSFTRYMMRILFDVELTRDFFTQNSVPQVLEQYFEGRQWAVPLLEIASMYYRGVLDPLMSELYVNRIRMHAYQDSLRTAFEDPEHVMDLLVRVFLRHLNEPNLMTVWNEASHTRRPVPLQCSFATLVMFEPEARDEFEDMMRRDVVRVNQRVDGRFIIHTQVQAVFYFYAIALPWRKIVDLFNLFNEPLPNDAGGYKVMSLEDALSQARIF